MSNGPFIRAACKIEADNTNLSDGECNNTGWAYTERYFFCHLFSKVVRHGPQLLTRIQITIFSQPNAEGSDESNCKGRYVKGKAVP